MAHPAKNASTVILLRPRSGEGFEVFLTRRPEEMDFCGGMYVFPGGGIRKQDCAKPTLKRCHGVTEEQAQKILGAQLTPELALAHWAAGIRELFEEAGVLICRTEEGNPLDMNEEGRRLRLPERRQALAKEAIEFHLLLESEKLLCDASHLRYFSRWITPEEFPIRFDTRFFLAMLPQGQSPLATSQEVDHSLWITPERSLQLSRQGSLPLPFPIFASLRTLAEFDSVEKLLAEYRAA